MNETHAVAAAKGVGGRASESPINKCFVCEQTLFLSFFFDALGNDRLKDEPNHRQSNLARVFVAHRKTKTSVGVHRFYYEGLGTDLRESPNMLAAANMAVIATAEGAIDGVADTVKEKSGDKAKSMASGVAGGQSPKLTVKAAPKEWAADMRKALKDPTSYIEAAVKTILTKAVDIFPQWRDNKISAAVLNTGAEKRLSTALRNFDAVLAEQTMPIRSVQVAAFGAERGASLARAFVNMLIEERCKEAGGHLVLKSGAKPVSVEFKFVGLFDAQSTVAELGKEYDLIGGWLGKIVGFVSGLVGGGGLRDTFKLDLPKHVQRVVHMVAGNETRLIAAVDTLSKSKALSQEETVYPGSQCDVIAGLAPMERGKVVDLAKLPARKMLFEAQAAGVPMYTPHQLEKIDPETALLFATPTRVSIASETSPVGALTLLQSWRRDTGIQEGVPLPKALFQAQKAYLAYLKAQHGVQPTITTNRAAFQVSMLKKRSSNYNNSDAQMLLDAWDKPQRLSSETMALFGLMCHPPALGWTNDVTFQDRDVVTTRPITGDSDLLDELKVRLIP